MRHDWSDFDRRFEEAHREIEATRRRAKIVAAIALPFYVIGVLLVLGLLAVALYGLARLVGLI